MLPAAFIKALFTFVQRHSIQHNNYCTLFKKKKRNINLLLITKSTGNDDVMKKKTSKS